MNDAQPIPLAKPIRVKGDVHDTLGTAVALVDVGYSTTVWEYLVVWDDLLISEESPSFLTRVAE